MSLHQETSVVQSLFGHLLHSDGNESKVSDTLLNAAYHSWKIQAPEIVVQNPVRDTLYINAGVAWRSDENSITTAEHLYEDIALFTVQEISFWIGEKWNLDSVEEFSEADVAEALGNYFLEFAKEKDFYSDLTFDTEKKVLIGSKHQVFNPEAQLGIYETTVSFPINVPELLAFLVKNNVLKENVLEQYSNESKAFYNKACPKTIKIDRDSQGSYCLVKSTAEVIKEYISDEQKSRSVALKIATLSKNKEQITREYQFIREIVNRLDTNYLHDEVSAIIIKKSEEVIYTLEEVKKDAWIKFTTDVDTLFNEIIPGYKESKWSDDIIKEMLPYSLIEPLLVTHTEDGKEIAYKQGPNEKFQALLEGTGVKKFKLKVNCVLIDTSKVLSLIKSL